VEPVVGTRKDEGDIVEIDEIRAHWQELASKHGKDLAATTKTSTIKRLEIDALLRSLHSILVAGGERSVLEVGCGNGLNSIALANEFPNILIDGIDYIPEMVASANLNASETSMGKRVQFFEGDVLDLRAVDSLRDTYDAVFSVRCVINLPTEDLQATALLQMADKVRSGGSLLLIENVSETYKNQNTLREALGLKSRVPDSYNRFLEENALVELLKAKGFLLKGVEDFASLHDLVLYVLLPAMNGGVTEYEHPLVEAATMVQLNSTGFGESVFGPFGQNRLYRWVRAE
jgi:SAM-dependent methyltransferase